MCNYHPPWGKEAYTEIHLQGSFSRGGITLLLEFMLYTDTTLATVIKMMESL